MADALLDAFAVLAVAYPRDFGRYDAAQIETWLALLEGAEPDAILAACRGLAAKSKWAPTVAEIREAAGCEEPGAAERRAASRAAADRHAAWVERQRRAATEQARERLQRAGKDPDSLKPGSVSELARGIGR